MLLFPARAVRVFSSALLRRKMPTLERTRISEAKEAQRQMAAWQAVAYACASEAERAAQRHEAEAGFTTLDVVTEGQDGHASSQKQAWKPSGTTASPTRRCQRTRRPSPSAYAGLRPSSRFAPGIPVGTSPTKI